ncbi:cytochrome c oxidase assembly protein [Streptomyces sp. NPDC055186]
MRGPSPRDPARACGRPQPHQSQISYPAPPGPSETTTISPRAPADQAVVCPEVKAVVPRGRPRCRWTCGRRRTGVLRALAPGPARRGLPAVAHSRAVGLLTFPPAAALLDLGGLWVLYRTPLFSLTQREPWLHTLVHAHVVAAGLLFTCTVCQSDPVRRRWGVAVRGPTLLAAGAAHAVLAKSLYASPPPGTAFTAADLHTGAQVMYYGGDLVEVALAVGLPRRGRGARSAGDRPTVGEGRRIGPGLLRRGPVRIRTGASPTSRSRRGRPPSPPPAPPAPRRRCPRWR